MVCQWGGGGATFFARFSSQKFFERKIWKTKNVDLIAERSMFIVHTKID